MKESSNGNYDFRLALDNVHLNLINPVVRGIEKTMGEIVAIVRVRGDHHRAPFQANRNVPSSSAATGRTPELMTSVCRKFRRAASAERHEYLSKVILQTLAPI